MARDWLLVPPFLSPRDNKMKYVPLALAALVASTLPSFAAAQTVSADIRIGTGPVRGRIIAGDPIRRPSREVVIVAPRHYDRPVYREVAVSRMHRSNGWWRGRGYRAITVWYDIDRDRYYDHGSQYRDGLREVVIYERDGRFYDDDHDRYTDRRHGPDRRDDQDDRRDDRQHRDGYDHRAGHDRK